MTEREQKILKDLNNVYEELYDSFKEHAEADPKTEEGNALIRQAFGPESQALEMINRALFRLAWEYTKNWEEIEKLGYVRR